MTAKGSELIFISRIKGDGSGMIMIIPALAKFMDNDYFTLTPLSAQHGTYIATEAGYSYIVKKKK